MLWRQVGLRYIPDPVGARMGSVGGWDGSQQGRTRAWVRSRSVSNQGRSHSDGVRTLAVDYSINKGAMSSVSQTAMAPAHPWQRMSWQAGRTSISGGGTASLAGIWVQRVLILRGVKWMDDKSRWPALWNLAEDGAAKPANAWRGWPMRKVVTTLQCNINLALSDTRRPVYRPLVPAAHVC